MEVWRKKGGKPVQREVTGLVRATMGEKDKRIHSAKSKRGREAQMERAETILVHDELICMRSTVCYS